MRNYFAHRMMSMSVRTLIQHIYPRLLAIHDLDDSIALPDPTTGNIALPTSMRDSYFWMEADGIYIIGMRIITVLLQDSKAHIVLCT